MADYHIFQSIIRLDYSYPEDFDEDARRVVESLLKHDPKVSDINIFEITP